MRPEDEPVSEDQESDELEADEELPGNVGPATPLDSGLFWLS